MIYSVLVNEKEFTIEESSPRAALETAIGSYGNIDMYVHCVVRGYPYTILEDGFYATDLKSPWASIVTFRQEREVRYQSIWSYTIYNNGDEGLYIEPTGEIVKRPYLYKGRVEMER